MFFIKHTTWGFISRPCLEFCSVDKHEKNEIVLGSRWQRAFLYEVFRSWLLTPTKIWKFLLYRWKNFHHQHNEYILTEYCWIAIEWGTSNSGHIYLFPGVQTTKKRLEENWIFFPKFLNNRAFRESGQLKKENYQSWFFFR